MRIKATILLTIILGSCASVARADEETVPLDKVPKAVIETVKKRFPKATHTEAAKETIDGKTEYEVSIKDGTTKIDVTLAPDGTLLCIEKQIPAKDLPKAVTDAVNKKHPKSTTKLAEEVIKVKDKKEKLEYYEVLIDTADKKSYELQIAADGTIKNTEDKTGKKD